MNKIIWVVVHPKYTTSLTLKSNWLVCWLFKKLMKNRNVEISKNKLRGQSFDTVYYDEFI